MIRKTLSFCIIVLHLILMGSCTADHQNQTLLIATAANMQFAMEELVEQFEQETKIKGELVISSSGKLTAQIKEGAPYNVFVSADMKYPKTIETAGLTLTPTTVYAKGKLVLWSMSHASDINQLHSEDIKYIALATPKTAPYGKAALEALTHYGLKDTLESKFVFGESIAQTNQFITTESAQVGFTAKSVVVSPHIKQKGQWTEVNDSAYTPIEQGIVVIKQKETENRNAVKFYNFMVSDKARETLKKYGYTVGE